MTSRDHRAVLAEYAAGTADQEMGLTRLLPVDEWFVHDARPGSGPYEGQILVGGGSGRATRGDREMLTRFVNLKNAPESEIADFASTYGALNLCAQHQMPKSYEPGEVFLDWPRSTAQWDDPAKHEPFSCAARIVDGLIIESADVWRFFARMAASIIRATTMLRLGERPPLELWQSMGIDPDEIGDHGQQAIADLISWWLRLAGVRVAVAWRGDRPTGPEMVFTTHTVFGGIGMQLAASAAAAPGRLAFCRECGALHRRPRVPQPGRDTYCQDCSNSGAAQRAATRRLREKRRHHSGGELNGR